MKRPFHNQASLVESWIKSLASRQSKARLSVTLHITSRRHRHHRPRPLNMPRPTSLLVRTAAAVEALLAGIEVFSRDHALRQLSHLDQPQKVRQPALRYMLFKNRCLVLNDHVKAELRQLSVRHGVAVQKR